MRVEKNDKYKKDVYLTEELLSFVDIGDSLIKVKNENLCYVKKPNGEKKVFYYVKIPMENREHWTFPKEWKDKWPELSVWDEE